jgi:hypothetical protein
MFQWYEATYRKQTNFTLDSSPVADWSFFIIMANKFKPRLLRILVSGEASVFSHHGKLTLPSLVSSHVRIIYFSIILLSWQTKQRLKSPAIDVDLLVLINPIPFYSNQPYAQSSGPPAENEFICHFLFSRSAFPGSTSLLVLRSVTFGSDLQRFFSLHKRNHTMQ